MNDTLIKETNDRVRRIETKLSRMISGEADQGVTNVEYVLTKEKPFLYILRLNTANLTVHQLTKITEKELVPIDSDIDVYDNDRFVMRVVT